MEAKSYCGARWQFDEYAKDNNRDVGINVANLFVMRYHGWKCVKFGNTIKKNNKQQTQKVVYVDPRS